MNPKLAVIINYLISGEPKGRPSPGPMAAAQFDAGARERTGLFRNINAAFLISLAGPGHPFYEQAFNFLSEARRRNGEPGELAAFLIDGLTRMHTETDRAESKDPELALALRTAADRFSRGSAGEVEAFKQVWGVFFPEGAACLGDRTKAEAKLRAKRRVTITELNDDPVTDPMAEVLFTSNALVGPPRPGFDPAAEGYGPDFSRCLAKALASGQKYWYDHPIPLGMPAGQSEVIHGLEGLASALGFERSRRTEWTGRKLPVLISVSVTHQGLEGPAREYLARQIQESSILEDLEVFLFTEAEARRITGEILLPAVRRHFPGTEGKVLEEIFGVDGEYGRHYSFLKAVAAWWQVLIDPKVKATFKLDLDQVFPQKELLARTGRSAFEHFTSPLWGARGKDNLGRDIELGLAAGALVNQEDIDQGLFTPDVRWPETNPYADEMVFFSRLPQAVSTEAEMMTDYSRGEIDGQRHCLQRVHVTGGTSGILVEALRRRRPFTPTFIGRAEDQAYNLSVLLAGSPRLGCLHLSGLIMRHDKEDLIPEVMAAAETGKLVGDYERILWFTHYARALPWPVPDIKEIIDPFTGCFVSKIPFSLVYLRLALKAAALFEQKSPATDDRAVDLLTLGARRLGKVMRLLEEEQYVGRRFSREKQGWNLYYDVLDSLEKELRQKGEYARTIQDRARGILSNCRI